MYLPQFYRVKENDEWWGDGYTDWIAMCKAHPLFEGHKQPKMPMDNYMYDLLQKETLIWQAGLMKSLPLAMKFLSGQIIVGEQNAIEEN